MLGSGPLGAAVSVSFDIPADAYESNYENLRDKILWLLHAQADVPGVDFSEDYELPVFRTGPPVGARPAPVSTSAFGTSFGGAAAATTSATTVQDEPVQRPATTSAVISTDWNGTQYYFPALRNPLQALILFGVTCAWSGGVYLIYRSQAPLLFALIFAAVDLLLIVAVLHSLFSSTRICRRVRAFAPNHRQVEMYSGKISPSMRARWPSSSNVCRSGRASSVGTMRFFSARRRALCGSIVNQ